MAESVTVYLHTSDPPMVVGQLTEHNHIVSFEYSEAFLATGLPLSLFKPPLKPGVQCCNDRVFEGLFGLFNDSLPDGWGRLLLDRKLMGQHINPQSVSPLYRLQCVGTYGMGALGYAPSLADKYGDHNTDIDSIADVIQQFQQTNDACYVDNLLALTGSSAGARPKIVIELANEPWLIKFPSSVDPIDIGAIEYAYHLMAKAAGLLLPDAQLLPARRGCGYFLALANTNHIEAKRATEIIEQVSQAIVHWPHFAKEAGVLPSSKQLIQQALQ